MILRSFALATIPILLVTGCSGGDDETDPSPASAAPTLEDLAEQVGCVEQDPAPLVLPAVSRRAASDGLRCFVGNDMIDIYERAPVEGNGGGSLQNIDMVLSTGTIEEGCEGWVLTGETWFIFSTSKEVLDQPADSLDSVVRPVLPAMPSYSYGVPPKGARACG